MTTNQTPQIEQARELLSAYIDNEVTADERQMVEAALAQSAQLQLELDSLQQTVTLIKDLPRMPAPRPFTLTPADVGLPQVKEKRSIFSRWLNPALGLAGLIFVVVVGAMLFNFNAPSAPEAMIARVETQDMAAESAAEAPQAVTVIETVVVEKEVQATTNIAPLSEAETQEETALFSTEPAADSAAEMDMADSAAGAAVAPPEPAPQPQDESAGESSAEDTISQKVTAPTEALETQSNAREVAPVKPLAEATQSAAEEDAEDSIALTAEIPSSENTGLEQQSALTTVVPPPIFEESASQITSSTQLAPVSPSPEEVEALEAQANRLFFIWVCLPGFALVFFGALIVIFVFTRKPKE